MRLIKRPELTTEMIDLSKAGGGHGVVAGRSTISNVEIVCPDHSDPKQVVWERLMYGRSLDLQQGRKIDKIEFPADNLILHGVLPLSMQRTACWEGRVFECSVDHVEVTK